jgi:hypothetical protein
MTGENTIKLKLRVDSNNQWFVSIWVFIGDKKNRIEFKIDTGCNSLVLSHSTLKRMGFSTKNSDLSKLPSISGALASGDRHIFRKLGVVSLCQDKNQTTQICKVDAVCHTTHETNDLLGTEVLRKFNCVLFGLVGEKFMELK